MIVLALGSNEPATDLYRLLGTKMQGISSVQVLFSIGKVVISGNMTNFC